MTTPPTLGDLMANPGELDVSCLDCHHKAGKREADIDQAGKRADGGAQHGRGKALAGGAAHPEGPHPQVAAFP